MVTADHLIRNEAKFQHLLSAAHDAAQDGYLVTLGITPSYPATGYGYIQQGEYLGDYGALSVYRALKFREKPSEALAREMLAGKDHSWNSGMFVWRVDAILEEFARQMPELTQQLNQILRHQSLPTVQLIQVH